MENPFHFTPFQILSGRRSKQRQSEFNLAVTLVSIVFMHIVCNALRVFLGVLVVALVGNYQRQNHLYLYTKKYLFVFLKMYKLSV